ncbi:MAG: hypothetical protein HRU37_14055 [Roseibacillus sp.]|nr:hypothetical protein [Roseibacillus sp.]
MKITPSAHPALFISALVLMVLGHPGLEALGVKEPWSFIPFILSFVLLIFIVILDRQAKPAQRDHGPERETGPQDGDGVSFPGALLRMGWKRLAIFLLLGVLGAAGGHVLVEELGSLGVSPSVTTLAICAVLLIQFQLGGTSGPKVESGEDAPAGKREEPEK